MKTNDEVYDSQGKLIYGYEQMESELRGLTKTLPVAHGELAGIAENAGQLGIASQDVVGFTEVIAKLGHTTNLSYDEASTALAKFLNVTGSGTDTVENLASSIVHLGNNTAATEREILTMGQRFAAVGSMMGLTDDQILGLSASMISLGVEVEAGSSAMQRFLLKTNDHVAEAGEGLYLLAQTAGMTASEFATAWENDPITAIESFLVGLNEVDEAGGNVNDILKELGITSVNEVKALLSLAQGHEKLAEALGLAAEGYAENTALSEEFAVYAETTAAKVEILKNRIRDIAIEFGGPLAEALTSALDAAEPWIERLAEMAEGFSSMDKEGQQNILMWLGIAAAAGPALSLLGNGISIVGRLSSALGTAIQNLGKWTTPKSIGETIDGLDKIPGSAGAAGASASLFSNPWVLGTAAAVAGLVAVGLAIHDHVTAPQQAHKKAVESTDGAYQVWFDGVTAGITTVSELGTAGVDSANRIKEAFEEASERVMENNQRIQEAIESQTSKPTWLDPKNFNVPQIKLNLGQETMAGLTFTRFFIDDVREGLTGLPGMNDQVLGEIIAQYDSAGTMITSLMSEISESKLNGQKVTAEWANAQISAVTEITNQTVENLNRKKEALIADLDQQRQNRVITEQEYQQQTAAIERSTQAQIDSITNSQNQINGILARASQDRRELNSEEVTTMMAHMMNIAEVTGQSISEIEGASEILSSNLSALTSAMGLEFLQQFGIIDSATAQTIAGMTSMEEKAQAVRKALIEYGMIELSDKEMALYVNGLDELLEITDLIEQWDNLTIGEKSAQVATRGEEELAQLTQSLGVDWESLNPEQKEAILNATGAERLEELYYQIGIWEGLTLEEKRAILEAQIPSDKIQEALEFSGAWEDAEFVSKFANIDTNAPEQKEEFYNLISAWTGIPADEVKNLLTETNASETAGELEVVSSRVEEINGQQVIIHTMSDGTEVTQAELEETGFIAQSIDGTNVGITMGQIGAEETRSSIEGVGHSLGEVPESKTTSITSSLIGMVANLVTIGLYNAATSTLSDTSVTATSDASSVASATGTIDDYNQSSGSMASTSVTASTSTPGLPGDTSLIDGYNDSSGSMTNTSATASTSAPGLPGDTALVDGWNSSSGAMTDSSSTASTSTPSISGNTSAVWSWIGALDSTYSTSSSLTTYVDTVYRTFGSPTRRFAEGGHIGEFAEGGDIQWGGMFANGGSVPRGFMGIVGEAGPELFHVTKSGVSITPLAPNEKMRGVEGAIEEYMQGKGKGGGGDTVINITFKDPVVREDADFDRLSKATIDRLTRDMKLQRLFGKGRT